MYKKYLIIILCISFSSLLCADNIIEKARRIAMNNGLEMMSEGHRIAFYDPKAPLEQEAAFYFVTQQRMPFDFAWDDIAVKVISPHSRARVLGECGCSFTRPVVIRN